MFSDAVAAIAITLLVLPLVDAVAEAQAARVASVEVILENQPQIFSFLLSFGVIARLWVVHRRLFQAVEHDSRSLLFWNMLWLLTVAVLPFPTQMIGVYGDDWFTAALYIGTVLASSVCLCVIAFIVRRGVDLVGAVTTTGLLAIAFVLAALVPGVRYFALLLLLLTAPASRAAEPLLRRAGLTTPAR